MLQMLLNLTKTGLGYLVNAMVDDGLTPCGATASANCEIVYNLLRSNVEKRSQLIQQEQSKVKYQE